VLCCTQSTYLAGFWEDARLRKYWAEGRLEFVLWDSTPECVGHLKCMQPLMYRCLLEIPTLNSEL
jgi:hypothetical protein